MSSAGSSPVQIVRCPECGTELAPTLVSCPSCQRLIYAERLRELATAAGLAEREERLADALVAWREAMMLLPLNSRQADVISEKIRALSERVSSGEGTPPAPQSTANTSPQWGTQGKGILATVGIAVGVLLTKGKMLLGGLTKAGTLMSMLASVGVYWTAFGWKFALGLVLTTYVHEIGHVAALRRYGIRATAPMFIPGFGAVVRLKDYPSTPVEDARVGLAGPLWGLAATAATYGLYLASHWPSLLAIAHVSAFINLFNLLPIWQLDGGRGLRSLARGERWLLVILAGVTWHYTGQGLLFLILLLTAFRALGEPAPQRGDRWGLLLFAMLLTTLALLADPAIIGLS